MATTKARMSMMIDIEIPDCTWKQEVSDENYEVLKPLQNENREIVLGGRNIFTYLNCNYVKNHRSKTCGMFTPP